MNSHMFDQRSWRLIKDFVGIYGIKMDYTKIAALSRKKLSKAYFKFGKLSRNPFKATVQYVIKYDEYGHMQAETYRGMRNMSPKEWKVFTLKLVAQGYKNKRFYENIATLVPSHSI